MLAFGFRIWPMRIPSKSQVGAMLCSRRSLASISEMLEEGRLRDINVFGSEHVQPSTSEHEMVMEAYSYSRFVNIPVNATYDQLNSIGTETLEKMLATSLLCKYRGTSTSIARAICDRREVSAKLYSYGHCILAFYSDEQWIDIQQHSTADDLFEYLQQGISDGLHNNLLEEVVLAVLKSWKHLDDIDETVRFLDILVTTDIHWESIMIGSGDILPVTLVFLRYHGHHALSHRLLSLMQHNLQRHLFDLRAGGGQKRGQIQSTSRFNTRLNDLIAFSACLFDKEDMKYVSNIYEFYVKNIFSSRSSFSDRLFDIENIMTSVLNLSHVKQRESVGDTSNVFAEKEKYFQNKTERALVGYMFFNRLHHIQKTLRSHHKEQKVHLYSSKLFTQVAMIIGHINPEDLRRGEKSIRSVTQNNINQKKLLVALYQLKRDFNIKFSNPSGMHSSHNSRFKSHAHFYSAYISSLQLILSSTSPKTCNVSKERDRSLRDVLQSMRHSEVPFGFTEEFSKAVVELFISPISHDTEHNTAIELSIQEENINALMTFITENRDCFHFDTISSHVIAHLCKHRNTYNANTFAPLRTSMSGANTDNDAANAEYVRFCTTASYAVCRFLKYLSSNGSIESFRDHCQSQEEVQEHDETPVQQYRNFKDCSDREWTTITLLQTACVHLFNLKHPAVVPELMVILSSLSTHQLVPYSYWSQAIQLCAQAKKWEELKVFLQLLLYQGKMLQYANVQSVLSAYISTHSPHIGFRLVGAMRREGLSVPAEAYRALCVAHGRLSARQHDGREHAEMAEKTFQHLYAAYGPIAFTGNFDTRRGANLIKHRTDWAINSQNETIIKDHLKDCEQHISCQRELQRIYEDILAILPSKYYEAGVFLVTTMISKELCLPNDVDIDRFIDAAIENDRLTLAASMLRSIKDLKENYTSAHIDCDRESDDDDDDDDGDRDYISDNGGAGHEEDDD